MATHVTPEQIALAATALAAGKLVAFPTETVYGIGADARNSEAVRRIFEAKGRPASNPLIVHVASFDQFSSCADLSRSFDRALVERRLTQLSGFWPGPLSVVLPAASAIAKEVCAGGDTMAIRIPRHPVALALLSAFGGPIAAPSANISNYISPTTAEHVRAGLGDAAAAILDGGPCEVGIESTVLSLLEETPRVLRPGAVTREQLSQALGCEVGALAPSRQPLAAEAPLLSPGLLAKHYSPRTPVRLLSSLGPSADLPKNVGAILFRPRELPFAAAHTTILSPTGNLESVAANLFTALREQDTLGLGLIVVDTCDPVGLGEAIMDRLLRAAG